MTKRTVTQKIFYVFNVLFLGALCFTIVFPYINVLAISFNDTMMAPASGLMLWPKVPSLLNYKALLANESIWRAIMVTAGRMGVGVLLTIILTFSAAFGLTRKGLPFRKSLVMFMFIPSQIAGGLIPSYLLYNSLGLLNNPLVYVLPQGFAFIYYILFRTYLTTIPDSLDESAKIDGANDFTVMVRIMLPLSMPIIATIALFTAVHHYNDWTTTLYFMPTTNTWSTLAYELQRVLNETGHMRAMVTEAIKQGQIPTQMRYTTDGLKFAQIVLSSFPILVLYPFLQKYFIRGIMVGGVKE